jgi:hypothetical protein
MLLHFAILEKSSVDQAVIECLDLELYQVVAGAAGVVLSTLKPSVTSS